MIRGTKFSDASHHPLSVWTDAGFFCGVFFFFMVLGFFVFFSKTLLLGKLDMQMPEYTKTTFNWTHLPTS